MITYGFITPAGKPIYLEPHPHAPHCSYLKNYLSSHPSVLGAFYTFEQVNSHIFRSKCYEFSPQEEFFMAILGWLKVGDCERADKLITYYEIPRDLIPHAITTRELLAPYEKAGYAIRMIGGHNFKFPSWVKLPHDCL